MNLIKSSLNNLATQSLMIMSILFILVLTTLPMDNSISLAVLTSLLFSLIILAGLNPWQLCRKAALVLPVAALLSAAQPFLTRPDSRIFLKISELSFSYSHSGLMFWLLLTFKTFLAACFLVFVTSLKPLPQILSSSSKLGLPRELVGVLLFTYRYLAIIADEAVSMKRAAQCQNFRPRNLAQASITGGIIANLLLRSLERAERVYQAMLARGYRDHLSTETKSLQRVDYVFLSVWFISLLLIGFGGLIQ